MRWLNPFLRYPKARFSPRLDDGNYLASATNPFRSLGGVEGRKEAVASDVTPSPPHSSTAFSGLSFHALHASKPFRPEPAVIASWAKSKGERRSHWLLIPSRVDHRTENSPKDLGTSLTSAWLALPVHIAVSIHGVVAGSSTDSSTAVCANAPICTHSLGSVCPSSPAQLSRSSLQQRSARPHRQRAPALCR